MRSVRLPSHRGVPQLPPALATKRDDTAAFFVSFMLAVLVYVIHSAPHHFASLNPLVLTLLALHLIKYSFHFLLARADGKPCGFINRGIFLHKKKTLVSLESCVRSDVLLSQGESPNYHRR